jgi:hypothetical protein
MFRLNSKRPSVDNKKGIILLRIQHQLFHHQHFGATSKKISSDQLALFNTELDLFEEQKTDPCCNRLLTKIGDESTKQMEYVLALVKVKNYRRFKYTFKHYIGTIKRASLPTQLIPRNFPTASLIAYLIERKYRTIG